MVCIILRFLFDLRFDNVVFLSEESEEDSKDGDSQDGEEEEDKENGEEEEEAADGEDGKDDSIQVNFPLKLSLYPYTINDDRSIC